MQNPREIRGSKWSNPVSFERILVGIVRVWARLSSFSSNPCSKAVQNDHGPDESGWLASNRPNMTRYLMFGDGKHVVGQRAAVARVLPLTRMPLASPRSRIRRRLVSLGDHAVQFRDALLVEADVAIFIPPDQGQVLDQIDRCFDDGHQPRLHSANPCVPGITGLPSSSPENIPVQLLWTQ